MQERLRGIMAQGHDASRDRVILTPDTPCQNREEPHQSS